MRIEIEIPKEFEEHFNQDKFKDSFGRIMEEIRSNLRSRYCSYAGRYEYETIEMLQKAFENSRKAYDVDKVVEELKEAKHEICLSDEDLEYYQNGIDNAIEIVKQEAEKFGTDINVVSNGWIPCSERMPEDEQVVLTCKYKSISILRYSTKTNHWYELSGNWWWSANMVTAWQPLPQPYQPKGE